MRETERREAEKIGESGIAKATRALQSLAAIDARLWGAWRIGAGNDGRVKAARAANLALKFLLELAAVAAFATWGASIDGVGVAVLLGVVTPVVAVALWSRFAAPKSPRRLPTRARVPFELTVFALAALSLFAAGHKSIAIIFSSAVAVNALLLTLLRQWDR